MTQTFNIYCDESCHLENDREPLMVLGGLICPIEKVREVSVRVRDIKVKYGLSPHSEIKWTRVSPSKAEFYKAVIDYFFDDDDLQFRAIVCDKTQLKHDQFNQNHDGWYYKMYFLLLQWFLDDRNHYHIYIDIKDTLSAEKCVKLRDVLCNHQYDFNQNMLERVQHVRSHETQLLQMSDLLIGAVAYANRGLATSQAKLDVIERIKHRSHRSLDKTNYSKKLNLFHWQGREE